MAIPNHNCTTPQDRHRWDWWTEGHENFHKIAEKGDIDLVFLGDSIMQQWENEGKEVWDKYYSHRNAANFGMSGDCTQHVIWRIDNGNFDGISPKLVVLLIGVNNCGYDSQQQIADGVTAIVQRLRAKLPKTKILVLGIFPMGKESDNPKRVVQRVDPAKIKAVQARPKGQLPGTGDVFEVERRAIGRAGGTPDGVEADHAGLEEQPPASPPKAQTEIDIFVVEKIPRIETAHLAPCRRGDRQCGRGDEPDFSAARRRCCRTPLPNCSSKEIYSAAGVPKP